MVRSKRYLAKEQILGLCDNGRSFCQQNNNLVIYFSLTPQNELLNTLLGEGKLSDAETDMNKRRKLSL
jgi:hypothetical protein